MFEFSTRSKTRLLGVHPELILVLTEALSDSVLDFGIAKNGGVRSAKKQRTLFDDPLVKTNADGYKVMSRHQVPIGKKFGEAVDIVVYLNGAITWDRQYFAMVGAVIMGAARRLKRENRISIELSWGGTFGSRTMKGWDAGHFEIKDGL